MRKVMRNSKPRNQIQNSTDCNVPVFRGEIENSARNFSSAVADFMLPQQMNNRWSSTAGADPVSFGIPELN